MALLLDERLGWQLRQVNMNNAFLNGDLVNEVFMQQPPGYIQYDSNGKSSVCRLEKALYGFRQAPHAWFDKLKRFLISVGFIISKPDASLFVRVTSDSTLYVLVYVDDIIITGSMPTSIHYFVQQLNKEFSLKDMGDFYYFLWIEATRSSTGSSTISKDDGDRMCDPIEYKSLVSALQYVVLTCLDIAYAMLTGGWILMISILHQVTVCILVTPVSWCSKKQQVVSRSTTEAKYQSLAAATSDVTWLISLLKELQLQSADTPNIWCDNSSAVAVAANPVVHSKFKHVELDLFFVQEKVANGFVIVGEVLACDQVADILTKSLSVSFFTRFRHLLQVLPIGKMDEC
ncbi:hypothetical protein CXB51_034153 [Gossypium anomalum]|uniref:Reverse transcriptase Ty1/copia-type domain-containing protein n=1 Tax=Gossypium anomalum TaxID=47600 RepID=A0A8J5YP07_9ROSI|nr:hypothetical protein CXB51_034153 [Gossypium anomalum]